MTSGANRPAGAARLARDDYAALYGPTTGDRIRLADTGLAVRVEGDDSGYGDEILGGCGKTLREGLLATSRPGASELDMLVSNVVVLDPLLGVRKTNVGIKDGRIVAVGRAGNPDLVDDLDLAVGSHTALVPGEGLVATPGAVDSHVHLSSPAILDVALSAGVTTVVGMGLGGVWDIGVNPEANLHRMIEAWRDVPLNVAFLARGSATHPGLLEDALGAGASGFKVHEDFGAQPEVIDTCLTVAERADVAVALHSDSLNESGLLADTVAATAGRTVHAYHVEGGGGHPNLLEILAEPHILPSSTTPTLPYTVNTTAELFPMTMTVHRQNPRSAGDVPISASRIRAHGIAAENELHGSGAISIINSDSMGMGRIGETLRRGWQLAAHLRAHGAPGASGEAEPPGGASPGGAGGAGTGGSAGSGNAAPAGAADNDLVLRFVAKTTINPAIAHGLADHVGAIAPGRLADLVLWQPGWFGAKPELVLKSGFVAWGVSGSGAGSTRLGQPRVYRPYFGGMGTAPASLSTVFVARAALEDAGRRNRLPDGRNYAPVGGTRGLERGHMHRNRRIPDVVVPADGSPVRVDGTEVSLPPAEQLPLTQLHHFA